jgi:hypothetical protein
VRWLVVCALCLTFTTTVNAQPRLGGRLQGAGGGAVAGGGLGGALAGSPMQASGVVIHYVLLEQPSVQQELRVSPEQQQKSRQQFEAQRQKLQGLQNQPRDQIAPKIAEMMAAADKDLQSILSPEQFKRLREIGLQKTGPLAMNRDDVAETVQLTAEQKQQIRALDQQLIETAMQSAQTLQGAAGGGGRPKLRELRSKIATVQDSVARIQAAKKNTDSKILALLNEEQKARWKEMQGVPFQGQLNLGPLGSQLIQ